MMFIPDQLVGFKKPYEGHLIMARKLMDLHQVDKDIPEQLYVDYIAIARILNHT